MTAVCRCFSRGPIKVGAQDAASLSGQTILIVPEPYLSRESLTASTGSAVTSSAALGATNSRLLQIQIETGKSVHVRISVNGDDTIEADTSDPVYSGENMFVWGPNHFISFIETA